jgi:hypothetical protein
MGQMIADLDVRTAKKRTPSSLLARQAKLGVGTATSLAIFLFDTHRARCAN